MTKLIEVNSCITCKYFGKVGYHCEHYNFQRINDEGYYIVGRVLNLSDEIPYWCPLDTKEVKK